MKTLPNVLNVETHVSDFLRASILLSTLVCLSCGRGFDSPASVTVSPSAFKGCEQMIDHTLSRVEVEGADFSLHVFSQELKDQDGERFTDYCIYVINSKGERVAQIELFSYFNSKSYDIRIFKSGEVEFNITISLEDNNKNTISKTYRIRSGSHWPIINLPEEFSRPGAISFSFSESND
jgi:hypothetical protein